MEDGLQSYFGLTSRLKKIPLDGALKKQKTEIQVLAEEIVDKCREQGFKVGQFELLIEELSFILEQRVYRFKHDLF